MAEKTQSADDPAVVAALEAQRKFKEKGPNKGPLSTSDLPEDGFEVFGPEPEVKKFGNAEFTFAPFKVRQIRAMVPHLQLLSKPLAEMMKANDFNITQLQEIDADNLVQLVALATEQTVEVVDEMNAGDFIWAVTKILTVNGDFFVKTLPRLAGGAAMAALEMVKAAMPGAGPSPSSTSSKPDTGS